MKKILLILIIVLFTAGVQASDLIIESKTQSYNEQENKLKFEGNVNVSVDDLRVVGDSADVTMDENQKLDTATFYNKPYAYEVKKNKKREVKANILKMSLITKIVKAQGDTQSIVFDGKVPIVVINADEQEYDTKTGVMTATGTVTIKYKDLDTFSDRAKVRTDKNGDLKVWFEAEQGFREVLSSRVPSVEPAYVMTVHKSQGSEFTRTVLVLPAEYNPLLSKELIYTAITRAKQTFTVFSREAIWKAAVRTQTQRYSGLEQQIKQIFKEKESEDVIKGNSGIE